MNLAQYLQPVLDVTQIQSLAKFCWYGMTHEVIDSESRLGLTDYQQSRILESSLQDHLYTHFYASGDPVSHFGTWEAPADHLGNRTLVSDLSAANCGTGFWDSGWTVLVDEGCRALIEKGGLRLCVPKDQYRSHRIDGSTNLCLRFPNGSSRVSPGFYSVFGENELRFGGDGIARIYWNISSAGAPALVAVLTDQLNAAQVPFKLKLMSDPRNYTRCDTAVLYVERSIMLSGFGEILGQMHSSITRFMAEPVPAFTRRLAPGLAIADSPQTHDSFGMHRCGALARGMVRAFQLSASSDEDVINKIAEQFTKAEIDHRSPHLRAGSPEFDFPDEFTWKRESVTHSRPPRDTNEKSGLDYLAASERLAMCICDAAVWSGSRCNWISAQGPDPSDPSTMTYGSHGADLYGGTAGIALFLASIYSVSGRKEYRDTAVAAINHALSSLDDLEPRSNGLYTGDLGVVLAAIQVAEYINHKDLIAVAERRIRDLSGANNSFDVISGCSGAILAYLALHEYFGSPYLLHAADRLGRKLESSAIAKDFGVAWPAAGPDSNPLTGLSHGAAGAALALSCLYAATGSSTYRKLAEAAVQYESYWFDARRKNWPDFRQLSQDIEKGRTRLPESCTWCHGAPGIALSRLRMFEILQSEQYLSDAIAAIETSQTHLESWLEQSGANFSLCHGVAGNADIFHLAIQSEAHDFSELKLLIEKTAEIGIRRYSETGIWPCGVGGGSNYSLMVGLAGIGFFYLRLAYPRIASPLDIQLVARSGSREAISATMY